MRLHVILTKRRVPVAASLRWNIVPIASFPPILVVSLYKAMGGGWVEPAEDATGTSPAAGGTRVTVTTPP